MNKFKQFLSQQKGISSIEFTLTIGFFIGVLFLIFEVGRITLASAYWDLAVAESIRETKNDFAIQSAHSPYSYQHSLQVRLQQRYESIAHQGWLSFIPIHIKPNDILVNIYFIHSYQQLAKDVATNFTHVADDACLAQNSKTPCYKNAAIAYYEVSLHFSYLNAKMPFAPYINRFLKQIFQRQFFVVQEHERSQFQESPNL